jgi:hypothetical protein
MPDEDSVPMRFPIRLHFVARDCDGMPIKYTRAEFDVTFGDESLVVERHKRVPHSWKGRGFSEYVAELDTELTSEAGSFHLVVTALGGLTHASAPNATRCVLLRRTIHVHTSMQQYIVAGVLAGIALALLVLLGVLLARCYPPPCRPLLCSSESSFE